ncbi:MAG TPA: ThuA domain-containing protein [Planctomycetota bacterium]|nr:ThuA domain-containing protein [Planctomycetota bacterium]
MAKKALIVWGGWDGHQPKEVAGIFDRELKKLGFETEVSATLDAFNDKAKLKALDLIVPIWTMGKITGEQCNNVCEAVRNGVGIGGVHGGMCDAFREATEWQFMTGGQWVAHPGNDGLRYKVRITAKHFITDGVPVEIDIASEQYYMHTDPSNKVLASTTFPVADGPHAPNGVFEMPVTWIRYYGKGRVFYCSLGHQANVIEQAPVLRMCVRGVLWAGNAESLAS